MLIIFYESFNKTGTVKVLFIGTAVTLLEYNTGPRVVLSEIRERPGHFGMFRNLSFEVKSISRTDVRLFILKHRLRQFHSKQRYRERIQSQNSTVNNITGK